MDNSFPFHEPCFHDSFPCHSFHLFQKPTSIIQSLDVVTTSNTSATDEHIWHCPPPSALLQRILQSSAKGMSIKFNDIRSRNNSVFFEKYFLGSGGVRAVGFAEYYNFMGLYN